ncbi:hypothetical protein WN51_05614 [Melipona quadrifasciata]|uniref:Uncharacterized protein n=1 Tax=Melipona quadrifasciata TaxID=166423 RepID=A0A0N0U3R6_9HYME|nr:hypothetical protein WN51_05614 [Melipona quadrifasciata]
MKQILTVCLLLTAADADIFLEISERPLNRFHLERWFPLSGYWFTPPRCHIKLGDLFSKDQQNKESESCTVVKICHSPLINETISCYIL